MKFTVERKTLVKMLKLLSLGGVAPDAHLRICAQGDQISLTIEDVAGTSFAADVAKEGVCFFRHQQLLPLLRSYTGTKCLTMEVNAQEMKFGSTSISRGLWEISLFENPATAPQRLIMNRPIPAPEPNAPAPEPDAGPQQMLKF